MSLLEDGSQIYLPVDITKEQQTYFNAPFQFSTQSVFQDSHLCGKMIKRVKEGDLVIVGSDGLFDNVFLELLTFVVNLVVMFVASGNDQPFIKKLIEATIDAYYQILQDKFAETASAYAANQAFTQSLDIDAYKLELTRLYERLSTYSQSDFAGHVKDDKAEEERFQDYLNTLNEKLTTINKAYSEQSALRRRMTDLPLQVQSQQALKIDASLSNLR